MKEAIQKAIEGGYYMKAPERRGEDVIIKFTEATKFEMGDNGNFGYYSIEKIFVDPLFWQCLGKAMGWPTDYGSEFNRVDTAWESYWIDFIRHLAEGKDAESFFNELLK